MKPYKDLSNSGKLRRLRKLAALTLTQYDLNNPTITYYTFATNLLYRIDTASGERYMLRLASPGWRTKEDLCSEALWIDALARDTAIPVPIMMLAKSGEYVLPMKANGIPNTWYASLMKWVPGRNLGHYLTVKNLEKMGRLFAELHHHGAEWNPPPGFTAKRFEHWLSRGEKNLILGSQIPFETPIAGELMNQLHHHVESAYAAIDRSDLRVIHCDLWHDNIKLHQGILHPLDFEDTIWGFRVHDIAMAMLDLLEDTDDVQYPRLLAAFRTGYESHMEWPVDRIEPFQIGRLLWKINWVARNHPRWLAYSVRRHVPVFEHYEKTGRIIRPPDVT